MMENWVLFIIGTGLVLVLGVLLAGVVGMAGGGRFNQRYGNQLMRMRIVLQSLVILFLLALVVFR